MKMVSTRGVKFKFVENEKILCYEPDPSKAKVLYAAKVLSTRVSKDEGGRKIGEYLIHFNGWHSGWDRWVPEQLILGDTEENRSLQQHLAKEVSFTLKNNRKRRLLEALMSGQRRNKNEKSKIERPPEEEKRNCDENEEYDDNSISSGCSLKLSILEDLLTIPDTLKQELQKDLFSVKNTDKLVRLPCQPNVVYILEAYLHNFIQSTHQSSTKNSRHMDCDRKLNLCKEVVDGLRIYFDVTLPHLLLYHSEKKQYEYFSKHFLPTCSLASHNTSCLCKNSEMNTFDGSDSIAPTPTPFSSEMDLAESTACGSSCTSELQMERLSPTPFGENSSDPQSSKCDASSLLPENEKASFVASGSDGFSIPSERRLNPVITFAKKQTTKCFRHSPAIDCRLCKDHLTWKLLPSHVYQTNPPIPSVIYGAHHLLRLFVKLPELLSQTSMPPQRTRILGKHLQKLLWYLAERQEELFHDTVYTTCQD